MAINKKINENDKGKLRLTIFEKNGMIIIDFGTSFSEKVAWIGLTKNEAQTLAKILVKKAKKIKN